MGMTQKLRQDALALLDRRAQVLPIQFEEVERAEHGVGIMTESADQVENGRKQTEDQSVAEDGDAVDIRRELIERQQHHDNDDDGRPEVGPSPAAGNVARPYRSPSGTAVKNLSHSSSLRRS